MIDALETVIAYLSQDGDLRTLVGARIAARHRYGLPESPWPTGLDGLTLTPATGETPDDAGTIRLRLEARAYASTPRRAQAIINRLRVIEEGFTRIPVALPSGTRALLYWLVFDDSPQHDYDQDIKMDFVRIPLRASVASATI